MDANTLARNFVQNYYGTLDKIENRPHLACVYRDTTNLVFEGQTYVGTEAIMQKLMCLPGAIPRVFTTVDAVPLDGYLLVNVMGQQKTDEHPLAFTHMFVLSQEGANIVIMKEVFRLVVHDV